MGLVEPLSFSGLRLWGILGEPEGNFRNVQQLHGLAHCYWSPVWAKSHTPWQFDGDLTHHSGLVMILTHPCDGCPKCFEGGLRRPAWGISPTMLWQKAHSRLIIDRQRFPDPIEYVSQLAFVQSVTSTLQLATVFS